MLAPRPLTLAAFLLVASLALLLASSTGLFRDREWGDLHVFIKHRPSTMVYFTSPLGESDLPPGGLPPREAEREAELVELVEAGGGFRRSVAIPF